MTEDKRKTTVQIPSVGADEGQSISQIAEQSISDDASEDNPLEKNLEEMLRQMRQMNDPAYLHTISMDELYETVYPGRLSLTA